MTENPLAQVDEQQLAAYGDYDGMGKENIDEKVTPFIHLVQSGSPEVKNKVGEEGDFCIRPFNVNLGKEFTCVIVYSDNNWVDWSPRSEGGGIRWQGKKADMTDAQLSQCEWDNTTTPHTPPKFKESRNFAALLYDWENKKPLIPEDTVPAPVVFAMSGTSAKNGKALNLAIDQYAGGKAPIFALAFNIKGIYTKNDKGEFYIYKAETVGATPVDQLAFFKDVHLQYKKQFGGSVAAPTGDEAEQPASE